LQYLETMGLASEGALGHWAVTEGADSRLRELGTRGDIIRTMGLAFAAGGQERPLTDFVINTGIPEQPIAGRLVDKGLHDELTGSVYAVIDGTDGRAHHVRFAGIEALEQAPAIGGIVELRAIARTGEASSRLILANRSDLDLAAQIKAPGATWLDRRLIERGAGIANGGFGAEVRQAMDQRTDRLVRDGLATRYGARTVFSKDLIKMLTKRELDGVGQKIARQNGTTYQPAGPGEKIAGVIRQRLLLASGRFAMIDTGGLGFSLVPWSNGLERQLGRHVSGVMPETGGIDWTLGRQRGLEL
jgi:hypothetical protein